MAREIKASPMKASKVTANLVERAREVAQTTGQPVLNVQGVLNPNCNRYVQQLQTNY